MSDKKFIASVVMFAVLVLSPAALPLINTAEANPFPSQISPIYIFPDGTVNPPSAPIMRQGDVYTLTGSLRCLSPWPTKYHFHYIIIQRDSIMFDGAGYIVEGARSGNYAGIQLSGRVNITILNTELRYFTCGVLVENSSKVNVSQNRLVECSVGVKLDYSSSVTVSKNSYVSAAPGTAILLHQSSKNFVAENTLSSTEHRSPPSPLLLIGVNLQFAFNNTVTRNTITSYRTGIMLEESSNNSLTQNNLISNQAQVDSDSDLSNFWSEDAKGNFWSDYNCTDSDSDGVGDSPLAINEANVDRYPLVKPVRVLEQSFPNPLDRLYDHTGEDPHPSYVEMPDEYVNLTISSVGEGALKVQVDIACIMHKNMRGGLSVGFNYPIPPNTTNIRLKLNDAEIPLTANAQGPVNLSWCYSDSWELTAIGNWSTIHCSIPLVPDDLVLEFHYEHPVEIINGSYLFLYELYGGLPELSLSSPTSTVHFSTFGRRLSGP